MAYTYMDFRAARRPGYTGLSLANRRTWYADAAAGSTTSGGTVTPPAPAPTAADDDADTQEIPAAIAAKLAAAEKRAADAEAALKKQQREASAKEKDVLTAQGQFKQLYETANGELEQLRPKAERVEALEATVKKMVDARVKGLPTQFQGLVPQYADPLQTLEWIEKNAGVLRNPNAPNLDPGAGQGASGGGGGSTVTLTAEEAAIAKRMGVSPEKALAQKKAYMARVQP